MMIYIINYLIGGFYVVSIGDLLKDERISLNLSQKQMAGNVISLAQYSRIERNEQQIKVDDLIKILLKHNINVESFFKKVLYVYKNTDASKEKILLSQEIDHAFFKNDIHEAQKAKDQLAKFHNADDLYLKATIVLALLKGNMSELDENTKKKIRNYFLKTDNWTEDRFTLWLFSSSMNLFEFETLNLFMDDLLNKYHAIEKFPLEIQTQVSIACCSYLGICYKHKNKKLAERPLELLKNLPPLPELFMFRMANMYYTAKFNNDTALSHEIKCFMKKMDMVG